MNIITAYLTAIYRSLVRNISDTARVIESGMASYLLYTELMGMILYPHVSGFASLSEINKCFFDLTAYGLTNLFFANAYFILLYGVILRVLSKMLD